MQSPSKFQLISCRNEPGDTKILKEIQGTQNSQNDFKREEHILKTHTSEFENYCTKAIIIQIVWYCHKDRYIINGIELKVQN